MLGLAFGERHWWRSSPRGRCSPCTPWRPASPASFCWSSRPIPLSLLFILICSRNHLQLCDNLFICALPAVAISNLAKLNQNLVWYLLAAVALLDQHWPLWSASACLSCSLRYCLLVLLVFYPWFLQELERLASSAGTGRFCCWIPASVGSPWTLSSDFHSGLSNVERVHPSWWRYERLPPGTCPSGLAGARSQAHHPPLWARTQEHLNCGLISIPPLALKPTRNYDWKFNLKCGFFKPIIYSGQGLDYKLNYHLYRMYLLDIAWCILTSIIIVFNFNQFKSNSIHFYVILLSDHRIYLSSCNLIIIFDSFCYNTKTDFPPIGLRRSFGALMTESRWRWACSPRSESFVEACS